MKILVTGATGFVGQRLIEVLIDQGHVVIGVGRQPLSPISYYYQTIDNLVTYDGWSSLLKGCDVVIHLAARVHVMKDDSVNPLEEFLAVNVEGTLRLGNEACMAGVKRMIYISSIKVNGEVNYGVSFLESDKPNPSDPYAVSKWKAELALQKISIKGGLEVVIIRPPLVYGPGVKGNFASMVRWIKKGLPAPFGSVRNKRSLVALDNLVSLIVTCSAHPAAANQTFLVSDGEDVSTTELLESIGRLSGVRTILIPVPSIILRGLLVLIGKRGLALRLLGSLQVDITKAHDLLGWVPLISLEEGLRRAVKSD